MPDGYELVYVASFDAPNWHFIGAGKSPDDNNYGGTIPKGRKLYLQRSPDKLGTHQSAYLEEVGRIIVRLGDFQPADDCQL
jgi:hypothetical protein